MTTLANRQMRFNKSSNKDSLVKSIRILSDITRRGIEKSYNIDETQGTETYYSNRYGWALRKAID